VGNSGAPWARTLHSPLLRTSRLKNLRLQRFWQRSIIAQLFVLGGILLVAGRLEKVCVAKAGSGLYNSF